MKFSEQIEEDKKKITEINEELKALREKKATITDAAELKAINKLIEEKMKEKKYLRADIRYCDSMNREGLIEYWHFVLGDD